jgi:surface protein
MAPTKKYSAWEYKVRSLMMRHEEAAIAHAAAAQMHRRKARAHAKRARYYASFGMVREVLDDETIRGVLHDNQKDICNGSVIIGTWDVSRVTRMDNLFSGWTDFNQDIGSWDTSGVVTMSAMFKGASTFNQRITWNTKNVRDMSAMFEGAVSLAKPVALSMLNVEDVRDMAHRSNVALYVTELPTHVIPDVLIDLEMMRRDGLVRTIPNRRLRLDDESIRDVLTSHKDAICAGAFVIPIGTWDVSQVTNMHSLFMYWRTFNQDIGEWDTRLVTNMSQMFRSAETFNADIAKWQTGRVTDMSGMFHGASMFNQAVGKWDTSSVTDMSSMFREALSFNMEVSTWNTSKVRNMDEMFRDAGEFDKDVTFVTTSVTSMNSMFEEAIQLGASGHTVVRLDTTNVEEMRQMFFGTAKLRQTIPLNLRNVRSMETFFDTVSNVKIDVLEWPEDTREDGPRAELEEMRQNGQLAADDTSEYRPFNPGLLKKREEGRARKRMRP